MNTISYNTINHVITVFCNECYIALFLHCPLQNKEIKQRFLRGKMLYPISAWVLERYLLTAKILLKTVLDILRFSYFWNLAAAFSRSGSLFWKLTAYLVGEIW